MMPKRALTNVSNSIQTQNSIITNSNAPPGSLKRRVEQSENENVNHKKSKNINDTDQENEKSSVFKKLVQSVNNRLIENITHSNIKQSIIRKKDDKQIVTKLNLKEKIDQTKQIEPINIDFLPKDKDQELIDNLTKLTEQTKRIRKKIDFSDPLNYYESPKDLPDDVEDYDLKNIDDINAEAQYSYDIFEYYFKKEKQFVLSDYIDKQPEISRSMRAILVDWIVELQDTLHLNHETIYLSVKIVDHYLSKVKCSKSILQLLGSTAVLIASKFDSRLCPPMKSFLYVCDNTYSKEQMIEMERQVLSKIDFNLGMPLSYRFLRRYARCAGLSMEILTFARYILEMCLLEYEFIKELDSKMASSCLLLVFKSRKEQNFQWSKTLEFYTHYKEDDLLDLMNRINKFMHAPMRQSLKTIKGKYLTSTYFRVATNNLLPIT